MFEASKMSFPPNIYLSGSFDELPNKSARQVFPLAFRPMVEIHPGTPGEVDESRPWQLRDRAQSQLWCGLQREMNLDHSLRGGSDARVRPAAPLLIRQFHRNC